MKVGYLVCVSKDVDSSDPVLMSLSCFKIAKAVHINGSIHSPTFTVNRKLETRIKQVEESNLDFY